MQNAKWRNSASLGREKYFPREEKNLATSRKHIPDAFPLYSASAAK